MDWGENVGEHQGRLLNLKLERLKELLRIQNPFIFEGECMDCHSSVIVTAAQDSNETTIIGGAVFQPPADWHSPTEYLMKCDGCYAKSPVFNPRTEVYSRSVGYYRPVNNFNPGKKAEWKSRKTFAVESMTVHP
jgi:hypothetical protein